MSSLTVEREPGAPGFWPIAFLGTALFGVVLFIAFRWGFGAGILGAAAGVAGIAILPNYRIAFLGLVIFIPHLGEIDTGGILPVIWLVPFGFAIASWCFQALFNPRQLYLEPRYTFLYAIFIVICVLSILLGLSPSLIPDWLMLDGLAYHRMREILFATLIGVLAMSACRTVDDVRRLAWTVVITGIPYAITLFFFGAELEPDGSIPRRKGFYLDAHPGAFHMQFCLWIAIALIRASAPGRARWFLIGACVLFLSTHNVTNARMIQATIPTMIILAMVLEGKTKWAFMTCVGLGVAFVLLLPVMPQNLRSNFLTIIAAVSGQADSETVQLQTGSVNLSTFAVRLIHIKWGLELWMESPWIGCGLGKHMWISNLPEAPAIHNYYVGVLAETGIFGFSAYSALVLLGVVVGIRFMRRMLREGEQLLAYFTESMLVIMASALMVFLTSMGNAQGERFIWLAMGLMVSFPALYRRIRDPGASLRNPQGNGQNSA
ncbi:MAG: O-antigen ligase [Verrucomicrobiales bacterium]|jgi:O-antigen ligase